jgi:MFS family permease
LVGSFQQIGVIGPALLVIGASWMFVMTTLNATAQVYLPRKFRARGMSAFVMFFSLGMGLGSLSWGWLAKLIELSGSLQVAAVIMVVVAILTHRLTLGPMVLNEPTQEPTVD